MKVFVFCVDGLEYNFIKDKHYPHLKQQQFFKVHIPRECMTIFKDGHIAPFTPIIWKVIFTGKIEQTKPELKPEEKHWKSKTLNWLKSRKLLDDIYVFLIQKRILKVGFFGSLGFKRESSFENEDTVISESTKSVIIHNPLEADVKWAMKGLSKFNPLEVLQSSVEIFQREKEETLAKLKDDWDLFIIYTKLLDTVGHLFWQKYNVIAKYYDMIENFAGEIQSHLPSDTAMIIVSDHGMQPLKGTKQQGGEHSHHAFASFNYDTTFKEPLDITDFYSIIKGLLQQKVTNYRTT